MKMRGQYILILSILLVFSSCASPDCRQVTSVDDLDGCKIGVLVNTSHDECVRKQYPNANVLQLNSLASLDYALSSGKCDAILTLEQNIDYLYSLNSQIVVIDSNVSVDTLAVAFRSDETSLKQQFNEFLHKIKSDSTLNQMRENWFGENSRCAMPDIQIESDAEPLLVGMNGVISCFTLMAETQLEGFEPDLMLRFGQYLNRPVKMTTVAFNAMIPYLNSGKCDLLIGTLSITPERLNVVSFSDSYIESKVVCATVSRQSDVNLSLIDRISGSIKNNLIVEKRYQLLVQGFITTINISFFAILFGTLFGLAICFLALFGGKFGRVFGDIYFKAIIGIPMLVLLMIMFYIVFAETSLSPIKVASFAFAINFSAYVSNMFYVSIKNIGKSQTEACYALGFTKLQALLYVVAPQSLKHLLPIYKASVVSLIKNTSIVGYIAILDLTKAADIIRSRSFDEFFTLIFISLVYFLTAWIASVLLDRIKFKW